ncbi:exosome complex RNA-binding protein Csl4 [Candidatus Micrarchaeota archaeon]|nr:exosome complex RNA-binding protein Csl4 [Candidatus Micrarchaeota archaeon]
MVLPGEFLSTDEESTGEQGTFEDKGSIYASVYGKSVVDVKKRSVSIDAAGKLRKLLRGDVVIGKIHEIYDSAALVNFEPIEDSGERIASFDSSGFLKVSELADAYVQSMRDLIKVGDYIKAKVLDPSPLGITLTIKERGLGVVKAYCSYCRTQLSQKGVNLTCPKCHSVERRKLSLEE